MEKFALFFLLFLFACFVFRLTLTPLRAVFRLGIHCAGGFLCLWLLNTVSAVTGILFPVNAVTVAAAGFGGLPGIAAMALLSFIT